MRSAKTPGIALTLFLSLIVNFSFAQDTVFARKMVDTLTSPYFWGRGYTKNGMAKAAGFLTGKFKEYGLAPMDGQSFLQPFSYPANTFPGRMNLTINGQKLIPGKDFIMSPDSRGVEGKGELVKEDSVTYLDIKNKIILSVADKLTWSVKQTVLDFTVIILKKGAVNTEPKTIMTDIENEFVPDFETANICGVVKGTGHPDSVIVYTAHYDHLGGMGSDTYFPGANDNASGVTQVLTLAKYYAADPQPYSMAFILFSGEEAGLVGSKYFTEHPLIPLSNIRFLINLDLEGTGMDGVTVVNATIHAKEFELLKQINAKYHYLAAVNPRGKAPNSDHFFFSEKDVPAFYLYTLGGIKAYHDIYDISPTLPLTVYSNMFKLIVKFNDGLMNKKAD